MVCYGIYSQSMYQRIENTLLRRCFENLEVCTDRMDRQRPCKRNDGVRDITHVE